MEYKGKRIMQEDPSVADDYRERYVHGIENFLEKMKAECGNERRKFMSPEKLFENPEKYRNEYIKMLGLDKVKEKKSGKAVEKVFVGSDDVSDIFRLTVYITDEIPFYAVLFIPHGVKNAPLVIAQHGGWGTPELCADMNGENNYNHMVQRVLERGAVVCAPQLLLWKIEEDTKYRGHNIPFDRLETDRVLKRFGMSMTALEICGIMSCIDYACTLDEVCGEKISMVGASYGGYFTIHTMAADTRIKAGYAGAIFNDRNVYDWRDFCYPSSAVKFHDAEVAALCAPRRLYVQVGKEDHVFNWKSAISEAERVGDYYKAFGCEQNFRFSLWEGGHTIPDDDEGFEFIFKDEGIIYD